MFSTRIATQIYAKICFETTPGQKKIIEKLSEYLADDDFSRIFVLNGYAGTGKTTLIAGLVGALKDLGIKPVLLAPTGRAAKVLAQYAQEKALTIHKRIYRQRTNADYESKFSLNINPERGAVFIVDEASMLSNNSQGGAVFGSGSLLSDLVEYVRSGRGCRLVLVGDSAQLPPVGADFSPALDPALFRLPAKFCRLVDLTAQTWREDRTGAEWKRLIAEHGWETARLQASLQRTDAVRQIETRGDCVTLRQLAVTGADFPTLCGRDVGRMLHLLLVYALDHPEQNTKPQLLAAAPSLWQEENKIQG